VLKLNIGSGFRCKGDYVNLDINRNCCVNVVADALKLPFKDCVFDEVYSRAVLEHFSWRSTFDILWEWRRVIKFDGCLIVIVPDWGWVKKQDRSAFELDAWVLGAQRDAYDFHKALFDETALRMLFGQVGLLVKVVEAEDYYLTVVGVK